MNDEHDDSELRAVTVQGDEMLRLLSLPCKNCTHDMGQHCDFEFDDEGCITSILVPCKDCGCIELTMDVDAMKSVVDLEERSEPATEEDLQDIERNSQ